LYSNRCMENRKTAPNSNLKFHYVVNSSPRTLAINVLEWHMSSLFRNNKGEVAILGRNRLYLGDFERLNRA